MARKVGKLTALDVTRMKEPGLHSDGGNLWLQISSTGAKSWVFRYTLHRKPRYMGLGAVATVSLAKAREEAAGHRLLLVKGKDPIGEARAEEARARLLVAAEVTFEKAAGRYIDAHKAAWGTSYLSEWQRTLKKYAYPTIGRLPVASIDTTLVLKVLEPIWTRFPVAAARFRGMLESILDWAKARELRAGENPARWRGHLQNLLAKRHRLRVVKHFPALDYSRIGDFLIDLRAREHHAAAPLEFTILTATRPREAVEAAWSEIDLEKAVWVIPAERMKSGRPHRVPLSSQAIALLLRMRQTRMASGDYVFPGFKHGRPLSRQIMSLYLKEMGHTDFVTHGFRSTFRDWTAECTTFAREVAEFALAHKVRDMTEASYFRSDLFEKRAKLMQAWADYCDQPSASHADNVVPINAAG